PTRRSSDLSPTPSCPGTIPGCPRFMSLHLQQSHAATPDNETMDEPRSPTDQATSGGPPCSRPTHRSDSARRGRTSLPPYSCWLSSRVGARRMSSLSLPAFSCSSPSSHQLEEVSRASHPGSPRRAVVVQSVGARIWNRRSPGAVARLGECPEAVPLPPRRHPHREDRIGHQHPVMLAMVGGWKGAPTLSCATASRRAGAGCGVVDGDRGCGGGEVDAG